MVTVVAGWLSLEFMLLLIVGILFISRIIGMEAYSEGQGSHAWSFLGRGVRNSQASETWKASLFSRQLLSSRILCDDGNIL